MWIRNVPHRRALTSQETRPCTPYRDSRKALPHFLLLFSATRVFCWCAPVSKGSRRSGESRDLADKCYIRSSLLVCWLWLCVTYFLSVENDKWVDKSWKSKVFFQKFYFFVQVFVFSSTFSFILAVGNNQCVKLNMCVCTHLYYVCFILSSIISSTSVTHGYKR